MKSVISLFSMALIASFALSSLCLAQNVTINLDPINPPIQIPALGGNFDYAISASNNGFSPQQVTVWCLVILPNGNLYGPVLGPYTTTMAAGQTISRQRTQNVPGGAPPGNYIFNAYIGFYPSTVWDSDSFQFEKMPTGGAELWAARYNGVANLNDGAYALVSDDEGNVYVTGSSVGLNSSNDYATLKYRADGFQEWAAIYNSPAHAADWAEALAVDDLGNVYVTGYSNMGISTAADYLTLKYSPSGVQVWEARYNGPSNALDWAKAIAVDAFGQVYVTGHSQDSMTSNDVVTLQYDSAGVLQWVNRYNGVGNNDDGAVALVVDLAGSVYVTGYSYQPGSDYDYLTLKYDSWGMLLWSVLYNGPANGLDQAVALAVDEGGNVYVTGTSTGSGSNFDYATIKYNVAGVQQWVARYNGPGNYFDEARDLAIDPERNVYITGDSFGLTSNSDLATLKYNASGTQLWEARFNDLANAVDHAYAIAVDPQHQVYVTGNSCYTDIPDYCTIKYNPAGVQQWVARYDGPGNSYDFASAIAVNSAGDVLVTGTSGGAGTASDYATIKYACGNLANWQPVEALVFGAQEPVSEYQLQPCYPNPFNATTAISYKLQAASHVGLRVYDSAGRLVATLVEGWREAGVHELTFDAGNLPSGVYFCKMQATDFSSLQKMVLVK